MHLSLLYGLGLLVFSLLFAFEGARSFPFDDHETRVLELVLGREQYAVGKSVDDTLIAPLFFAQSGHEPVLTGTST